jgi:hypothetical protein
MLKEPMFYDNGSVVHACEGDTVHPGVVLIWTKCSRDVPANQAFRADKAPAVTCPHCLAALGQKPAEPRVQTHERAPMIKALVDSLRPFLAEGEKLVWRAPFRWMDDEGVRANHFEMFEIASIAADLGFEVVHNFHHVAVIRERAA